MKVRWPILVIGVFCSGLAGVFGVRVTDHPIGFTLTLLAGILLGQSTEVK